MIDHLINSLLRLRIVSLIQICIVQRVIRRSNVLLFLYTFGNACYEYHLAHCMSLITTFFKTKKTFLITILALDVMHRSFLLSSPVLLLRSTGICFDLLKCPLPVASTSTSRLAFQVCLTSCSVPLLRGFVLVSIIDMFGL